MCGICGIVSKDKQVSQSVIQKMASVMDYRGPDDEGYSFFGNAGLGHRRLSVIDITGGHQPMSNEDGTLFLVCNGEIYNFKQLRDLLENKGHRIKTRSDNEIILHLYAIFINFI